MRDADSNPYKSQDGCHLEEMRLPRWGGASLYSPSYCGGWGAGRRGWTWVHQLKASLVDMVRLQLRKQKTKNQEIVWVAKGVVTITNSQGGMEAT
jgi:hypothetical protein